MENEIETLIAKSEGESDPEWAKYYMTYAQVRLFQVISIQLETLKRSVQDLARSERSKVRL